MTDRICFAYSEHKLTPAAIDVIRAIKEENGFADVVFDDFIAMAKYMEPKKILVFGSQPPEGVWNGVEFIYTYSIPQIMTKANAATVLSSSLNLYFSGTHEVSDDFRITRVAEYGFGPLDMFYDPELPTAIDIETDGLLGKEHTPDEVNVISVALYQEGKPALVYAVEKYNRLVGTIPMDAQQHPSVSQLVEQLPMFKKAIYHNGKFDIRVLERYFDIKLTNWFDTMLAHHTLNHAAGEHALKALARRYFGAPDWEGDIKQYLTKGGHYENIPVDRLTEYNGWDVYWTYQLWKLLAPQIESDERNETAFLFEMSVADMLLKVEKNGVPLDAYAVNRLNTDLGTEIDGLLEILKATVKDDNFKPNSPQQVKRALEEKFGISVASTAEGVLQELLDNGIDGTAKMFIELLLQYRGASKARSTYVKAWSEYARVDSQGILRVKPTFLVHGTSTGRLSSTGPNVQNMPRDKAIRKIVGVS